MRGRIALGNLFVQPNDLERVSRGLKVDLIGCLTGDVPSAVPHREPRPQMDPLDGAVHGLYCRRANQPEAPLRPPGIVGRFLPGNH